MLLILRTTTIVRILQAQAFCRLSWVSWNNCKLIMRVDSPRVRYINITRILPRYWYGTVQRLRLRLQICLNLKPVSICSISVWLFITHRLKYSNFTLFESILGIVTTLTNDKYWYFTLLKIFINWYVIHSLFFINDEWITWQFKNLFN